MPIPRSTGPATATGPAAGAARADHPAPRAAADLEALMQIRSLELRARGVVEGMWRGLHRSPTHGFSVEFTEYRPYSPGDDVRFLDWRLYARSDRDYLKKYEDETNLRCQLVVDQSRSMAFGSAGYSKAQYGATLAASLATFLFEQGDAVGVTTFGEALGEHLPARNRPGHLRRLFACLERPPAGTGSAVGATLDQVAQLLHRRGLVVLISDLLVPPEECARPLGTLRAAGHEVLLLQLLDPAERELALDRPVRLRDLESGAVLDVDPEASRGSYQRALADHQGKLEALCAGLGVERHLLGTERDLAAALLDLIGPRGRRRGRR